MWVVQQNRQIKRTQLKKWGKSPRASMVVNVICRYGLCLSFAGDNPMQWTRLIAMVCLPLLALTTMANQDTSADMKVGEDHIFVHDGIQRTYKIYRPENLAPNAPLVVVLHGMNSSSTWSYGAGFNKLADRHGFLALYPQSHDKLIVLSGGDKKSAGKSSEKKRGEKKRGKKKDVSLAWLGKDAQSCKDGESFIANGMEIDCHDGMLSTRIARWNDDNADASFDGQSDVEFLSALVNVVQQEQQVNPERTFVAGFSNGGYMSYTLMCQANEVFKGAAVVAGLINRDVLNRCAPDRPLPIVHIHGADDVMVPIEGESKKGKGPAAPGAEAIVEFFASLNPSVTKETAQVTQNTALTTYRPNGAGSSSGAEIHYYRIEDHDHIWPGNVPDAAFKKKPMVDESGINASELIWTFFSRL